MIVQEPFRDTFVRTYSDKGMQIEQVETGILYDEAIDVMPCRYTYTETDIPRDIPTYETGA